MLTSPLDCDQGTTFNETKLVDMNPEITEQTLLGGYLVVYSRCSLLETTFGAR